MIMRKYIIPIFSLILLFHSCYKDNGNYEYTTEMGALIISEDMNSGATSTSYPKFKIGTTVTIEAKYEIADPMLSDDDLAFEWYLGNEVVSTQKTLVLEDLPLGSYTGVIVITDLRYDIKYESAYSFGVESIYVNGWAMISEQNGKSVLSYLELDSSEDKYKMYTDVYPLSNDGDELSQGVKGLIYTFYNTSPYSYGLTILQPAPLGPVEVNANTMKRTSYYYDRFISPVSDMDIVDAANSYSFSYVFTSDKKFYLREDSSYQGSQVPNTGLFSSIPVPLEDDMELTHVINTSFINQLNTYEWGGDVVAFDSKNSRLVLISESKVYPADDSFFGQGTNEPNVGAFGTDGEKTYEDITFPLPSDLSEYNVISMNGVGFDTDYFAWEKKISVAMLLQRKTDNKLFFYTFRLETMYGSYDIDLDLFFPVPDGIDIDVDNFRSIDYIGGPSNILYFTANDDMDIYFLDTVSGLCNKIYSSDVKITVLAKGEAYDFLTGMDLFFGDIPVWSQYYSKLIIATADGSLKILNADESSRDSGSLPVELTINPNIGEFKHIVFMSNAAWSF